MDLIFCGYFQTWMYCTFEQKRTNIEFFAACKIQNPLPHSSLAQPLLPRLDCSLCSQRVSHEHEMKCARSTGRAPSCARLLRVFDHVLMCGNSEHGAEKSVSKVDGIGSGPFGEEACARAGVGNDANSNFHEGVDVVAVVLLGLAVPKYRGKRSQLAVEAHRGTADEWPPELFAYVG